MTALGAFVGFWIYALEINGPQGREVWSSIAAISTLVAIGYQRLRLPVWARLALPAMGVIGTLFAISTNVVGVFHYSLF